MSNEPSGTNPTSIRDPSSDSGDVSPVAANNGRGIAALVITIIGLCGRIVVAMMPGDTDLLSRYYSDTKATVGMITLLVIVVGTLFSGVAIATNQGRTQGVVGLLLGAGFLVYKALQIANMMG